MRLSLRTLVVIGLILPSSVSFGQGLPKSFTLGEYIPADVWFYMNFVENPEAAWLNEQWEEVFTALKQSGIDRDVVSMMTMLATKASGPAADPAAAEAKAVEIEETVEKLSAMFKKVKWDSLAHEVAFGMRMAKLPIPYDYFIVMRGKPDTGKENMDAIVEIVQEFASWTDALEMTAEERNGLRVWRLGVTANEGELKDSGLYMYNKGDMIGVVIGSAEVFNEAVALLEAKDAGKSVVKSERFLRALKDVKAPEEGVVYFDAPRLFDGLAGLMKMAVDASNDKSEEGVMIANAINKGFDLVNILEYTITTVETEGRQQKTHEVVRFKEGKSGSPLCKMLMNRKPFEKYDKYIPASAKSFTVTGLIDLEVAYDMVIDFIKQNIEGGDAMITEWDATLVEMGFNPKEDVFSWFSGEMISVQMPAEIVTQMNSGDWVLMFRVTDTEKANTKVFAAMDKLNELIGGVQGGQPTGQGLTIMPASTVKAEGFKEVMHPMMAMMGMRPVIGVHDGWLTIASSSNSINKCLDVASGAAPSIATNPRFKEEGLIPKGAVHTVSFTDTTMFGEELAAMVGMVGMMGGMATAQIPDPEAKEVIQSALSMLMKMGPVLQKLDFFSSDSVMVTQEENVMRTERLVTYKDPESLKASTSASAGSN
ncbi:MAG: hypothetical protein ACYTHJ_12145 [Planctomycetota bacterium]|jgi:hypothetical protein